VKQDYYGILELNYYDIECLYQQAPPPKPDDYVLYLYFENDKIKYKVKDTIGSIQTVTLTADELGIYAESIKALLCSSNPTKLTPEQRKVIQVASKKKGYYRSAEEVTDEHVRRTYKRLALEKHPDKQGGKVRAFQLLNEAQETLLDPEKREKFDSEREPTNIAEETPFHSLPSTGKPYSEIFKRCHANFVQEYRQKPLKKGPVHNYFKPPQKKEYRLEKNDLVIGEYSNIFLFLQEKAKHYPAPSIKAPKTLTPHYVIELLTQFLHGEFYGELLPNLKKYLEKK
jgi:hypothetical protein